VVLAPTGLKPTGVSPSAGRSVTAWLAGMPPAGRRWGNASAVAAGCLVVAGAFVSLSHKPADLAPDGQVALAPTAQHGQAIAAVASDASAPELQLVRSPELDRYLNAHRQFVVGPLSAPGGVRQVALTPDGR
jgi:hypothetical protein